MSKQRIYAGDKNLPIPNCFAVMRYVTGEDSHPTALGIVGPNYTPLQNRDAFSFFDPMRYGNRCGWSCG